MIEAQTEAPEDRARLKRLLTFWGAGGRALVTVDEKGEESFHSVPKRVFEAFQTPWLGDGLAPLPDPAPVPVPPVPPKPVSPITTAPAPAPTTTPGTPGPTPTPPVQPRPRPSPALRLNAEDLRAWKAAPDEKLRNAPMWNAALHKIINSIDPRRVGADLWLWERFLTAEQVKLAGTSKETTHQFVLPLEEWVLSGLEAFALLTTRSAEITNAETEYYKRQLGRMVRRLEVELAAFFDRRLSVTADGIRWNPAAAAAEVLLVRAWLRGVTLPHLPTEAQFTALLSDESGAESDPKSRTKAWQDVLSGTNQSHAAMRTMLRRMLATPQGAAAGFGLASGVAAKDLVRLIRNGQASGAPASVPSQHQANKILEGLVEQLRAISGLKELATKERDLVADRATRLAELMRGRGIKAHAQRLDIAISQGDEELPSACPDRVRAWKLALERMAPLLQDKSVLDSVQSIIIGFVDERASLPSATTDLLELLVQSKANALETIREGFATGESAVEALLVHAQAAVGDDQEDGVGLDIIREKGRELADAVEHAREVIESAQL
jgi:hypothetical protein